MLKEKIDSFFKLYKKEISINDLISKFKLNNEETLELINILYELEIEGKIIGNENGCYMHVAEEFYLYHGIIEKSTKNNYFIRHGKDIVIIPFKSLAGAKENDVVFIDIKKGKKHDKQLIGNVVRVVKKTKLNMLKTFYKAIIKREYTRNYYYVEIGNKKIYISDNDLCGAYPYDTVSVQVINNKYAKVLQILKRAHAQHILEYKNVDGKMCWKSLTSSNCYNEIIFPNKQEQFAENDRILVNLTLDNKAIYIKKQENENSFKSNISMLLYDDGYPIGFSEKCIEEANSINQNISIDDINERTDLRNLTTFTIDGEYAKDLDDAISIEFKDNKYILYVHIADVTHYVKLNSYIFNEAYAKGTSVYPANFVFPMLPEDLSNGICSLNPNVDRLTKTCKIVYDSEGNVLDYSIFDSVINSNYRMTYSKVNDILEKNIVDDQYLPYIDLLYKMNDLSNILQKNKISRGSMCFETPELQFVLSEEGKIQEIYDKSRGPSELMIENFMLATNEIIASFAYHLQVPFAYRNHEGPTVEQISKLKNILYTCKRYFNSIKNADHPKRLHKILLNISKTENSGIMRYFSKQILSCMNRAYYGTENIGHYALALDNYATFTSPIRRFPDLLNHMIIGKILNGEINNLDIETDEFKTMCEHCSEMQLISDSFERNIDSLLLHNYISEFSDKVLQGEIIFITDEFVCIKTQESIYGNILIKKKMLKDGYVNLEGDFYKVGDTICVRIGDINPKNSEVTFIYHKQNLKTKKKGSK